jgi:hypothetical protein
MTAPRNTGIAACQVKVAFTTRQHAAQVCRRHSDDDRRGRVPYRCAICHGWHIGHAKQGRKPRPPIEALA